jgi:hypothetical protein
MDAPPQRMTVVLEHISATSDHDEESYEDYWYVVAYLILDSGKRKRVTLHQSKTRADASKALNAIWDEVTRASARRASAA